MSSRIGQVMNKQLMEVMIDMDDEAYQIRPASHMKLTHRGNCFLPFFIRNE